MTILGRHGSTHRNVLAVLYPAHPPARPACGVQHRDPRIRAQCTGKGADLFGPVIQSRTNQEFAVEIVAVAQWNRLRS